MSTVYEDAFYDGSANTKVILTLKEKSILSYERDLLKRILDTIAKCSNDSSLNGVKELARVTLQDLG